MFSIFFFKTNQFLFCQFILFLYPNQVPVFIKEGALLIHIILKKFDSYYLKKDYNESHILFCRFLVFGTTPMEVPAIGVAPNTFRSVIYWYTL